MSGDREVRKLITQSTWYHDKDSNEIEPCQEPKDWPGFSKPKKPYAKHLTPEQRRHQPSAVLFVPRSDGGQLITALRGSEVDLQGVSTASYRRLKLVEEGGLMIRKLLVMPSPVKCEPCGRPNFTSCTGEDPQPEVR